MTKRLPFGVVLAVASGFLSLAPRVSAQNAHPDRPPQRQQTPARNTSRPPVQNQNANRPPAQNQNRPQTAIAPQRGNNFEPNNSRNDRPNGVNNGARMTPRQQIGVGSPRPFVDRMRDLTPQQRDRVLQNSRTFQNLAPEQQNRIRSQFSQWDRMTPRQQADLREKENTWRNLTPGQRDHIKNDVLPQWRQMPWQRQQVIQQKLGVLQNMPESARNQRLADPNFTRGMSDSDKSMLHDLSHLHVGGAPDPPGNEQ
jgi:Protein of unknown function (DUF3106)